MAKLIGTDPEQVSVNGMLGSMAFQDAEAVTVGTLAADAIAVGVDTVVTLSASQTLTNKSLVDSSTTIVDETDGTKKLAFQVEQVTTGTTRTATVQDLSGPMAIAGSDDTLKSPRVAELGNMAYQNAEHVSVDKIQVNEGITMQGAPSAYGWHDMLGPISIRGTGASDPSYNVYQGGIRGYQFDVNESVFIEYHVPHDYVPGSDLYIHAHWSVKRTNTAGVATNLPNGGSVTWGFEVSYAKGHQQAAFSAPITLTVTQNANTTTEYYHMIAEVVLSIAAPGASQLDSDDIEVDGLILVRAYLSANNMTVASGAVPAPFLHMVDIHYQSTGIATKNKAPNFYS